MDIDPLTLTLVRAWEALEPMETPMAVMGGISLAAWNHPRFTQDVDLLLALPDTEKDVSWRTTAFILRLARRRLRARKTPWSPSASSSARAGSVTRLLPTVQFSKPP